MTGALSEQSDPVWKGIFSWQVGLVLIAFGVFWFTIIRPDNIGMVNDKGDPSMSDVTLCSLTVLDDVDNSEPMKLLRQGKRAEAVAAANNLLQSKPYDVRTLMVAGDVFAVAGNQPLGLALLLKSTYLCPQSRYVRLNYARYLARSEQLDDAIAQYELLCSKFTVDWTNPRSELAELYVQKKEPGPARDKLRDVVSVDTKNGGAQEKLGIAMAAAGEPKEGFDQFMRGCVMPDQQRMPPEGKAYIEKAGSISAAEESLRREMIAKPDDVNVLFLLTRMYIATQRWQEAKELLNYALTHSPKLKDNADVYLLMSEVLDRLGNHDDAVKAFKTGYTLMFGIN